MFLHFSLFRSLKSNGNISSQPLENVKILPLLVIPPLLLTLPKTGTVGALQDAVKVLMVAAQEGRVYSNLNDHMPSKQYAGVYTHIPITVDYFYHSPFFPTARTTEEDSEVVSCNVNDEGAIDEGETKQGTTDEGETKQGATDQETTETETNASVEIVNEPNANIELIPAPEMTTNPIPTQEETTAEVNTTTPSKPLVQFPRFYLSSLHSFNGLIPYLSTLVDSTNNSVLTLSEAFDAVNTKLDYRCVLVATGVTGQISEFDQTYSFEGEKNRKKLSLCLMDRLSGHFTPSILQEETEPVPGVNRSWGKGKKAEPAESTQLRLSDCLELKKPTTVLLGKNRSERCEYLMISTCQHCHQSSTIETTPFLARLPPLLLIQLKRFKYSMSASDGLGGRKGRSLRNQSFGRQKIDTFIECPVNDWDVSEYLLESLKESVTDPQVMHYELIGVVNHSGTADFGHYFAFCKDGFNGGDNWFEYNDASVSAVKEENVITKNAYVLMYRRKDLGKAIYSRISEMPIVVPGAKKIDIGNDMNDKEKPMEIKLERNRKDGIDNERKDVKDSMDSTEPIRKKRMSVTERKLLKKMEKEMKHKGK